MSAKITGFKEVMDNLRIAIKEIEGATMKGLIVSTIIIRRDMEKTSPMTPIDTGNLRASWFVVSGRSWWNNTGEEMPSKSPNFKGDDAERLSADHQRALEEYQAKVGNKLVVICGFSANYAVFVHEAVDAKFARPGSGAKFFEYAIIRNHDKILETIHKNAKIK